MLTSNREQRLASFDLLCRCLAEDGSAVSLCRDLAAASDATWRQAIEAAGEHFVLPLLWRRLTRKGLLQSVPALVAGMVEELHGLNRARNLRLKAQVIEIGAALHGIGVTAVLLKGANSLFEPEERLGERMMTDLDLLVPAPRLADCITRLAASGYRLAEPEGGGTEGFHYPPLVRPGDLATVEVHTHLGEQSHILGPEDAIAAARPVAPGLAAASATHRVVHNVFHAAAQNRGHALGFVSLKDLCEFASLSQDPAVDWAEVRRRFAGRPALLASHAGLAVRLLGWVPPAGMGRARIGGVHYWLCRCQIRVPAVRRVAEAWASVSYPVRRTRIEYLFGESPGGAALALRRLRHLAGLMRRHGRGIFGRLAVAHANFRARPVRW